MWAVKVTTSRKIITNVPEIREYYFCDLFLKNLVENTLQITLELGEALTV